MTAVLEPIVDWRFDPVRAVPADDDPEEGVTVTAVPLLV
jgi:hypothetical protein